MYIHYMYTVYTCMHVHKNVHVQVVIIRKSASAKLGVSIKGGTKSTKGNPLDPTDNGIFISKVMYINSLYISECSLVFVAERFLCVCKYMYTCTYSTDQRQGTCTCMYAFVF